MGTDEASQGGGHLCQGLEDEKERVRDPEHLCLCCAIYFQLTSCSRLPRWLRGKESACNAGDVGSIPGLGKSPGGGHGCSLQYYCLKNPHGQRSLAGGSPLGYKESDTTERPSTSQHVRHYKARETI